MPYSHTEDLPESVTGHLPAHAQEIYKEAYNSAWKEYKDPEDRDGDADREEVSHKVAWSAVKKQYAKGKDGDWHKKD